MPTIDFDALDVSHVEMQCPVCQGKQSITSRSLCRSARMTMCTQCKTLLVCHTRLKTEPNSIVLSLEFSPVLVDNNLLEKAVSPFCSWASSTPNY